MSNEKMHQILSEKQQAEQDELMRLYGMTAEQVEEAVEASQAQGMNYSIPIIPYYSLFKLFNDTFYFLQIPLGAEDFAQMGGMQFITTRQLQTKNPYTNFYTDPFRPEIAGTKFGSYGRKWDTVIDEKVKQVYSNVQGKKIDDKTSQAVVIDYKDIHYTLKPVQIKRDVEMVLGVVLQKSDIGRFIEVNEFATDDFGNQLTDDEGKTIVRKVKKELIDFFIGKAGTIFEKDKTTLKKGSPTYSLIYMPINDALRQEIMKVKARYKNKMKIRIGDNMVVDSDRFNVMHYSQGAVLEFSRKKKKDGSNNWVYSCIDHKFKGLLVEGKTINGKRVGVPTELGENVRDLLIEHSPIKDELQQFLETKAAEGLPVTHYHIIGNAKALPTLDSMGVREKMLQPNQIATVIETINKAVENHMKANFPERYGSIPEVQIPQENSVPRLTAADKQAAKEQIPMAEVVEEDDEMGDDLPF